MLPIQELMLDCHLDFLRKSRNAHSLNFSSQEEIRNLLAEIALSMNDPVELAAFNTYLAGHQLNPVSEKRWDDLRRLRH